MKVPMKLNCCKTSQSPQGSGDVLVHQALHHHMDNQLQAHSKVTFSSFVIILNPQNKPAL